ncbi:MAG TPA: anti-sigma factor [Candidatus Angelobacter sp.]|nr:anti-sigma factor [Candidatus Angelobacter sp.]
MNCLEAGPLIDFYADGELDAARILELEQHFRGCPACALAWRNAQALKKALKQEALFFPAPAELRRRVRAELRSQIEPGPARSFWNWNWLTAATSGLATACLALLLTVTLNRPSADQRLAQEIVSGNIRSLMASHMLDVVSTDQHTVKPWFNGKLDFSPPVKDFVAQGFPLVGGRLDYISGRSVAALVFQRHKHIINLFIWPMQTRDSNPAVAASLQGYNVIQWTKAGMTFWTVSDLNEKELMEFVQDYDTENPPGLPLTGTN